MKIVVLDGQTLNPGDNPWTPLEQLGELTIYPRTSNDQIVERSLEADIVLTNKVPFSADTISQLERLKFIAVTATGFNQVDLMAAKARGIPVSNVPVYSTQSVAQHVFAMILCFNHRPHEHHQAIQNGEWKASQDFSFTLSTIGELVGKTFGLIGFGRIGQATAKLANAFGMSVIALKRSSSPSDHPYAEFCELRELLQRSDYVSLHLPQTKENSAMVDEAFLKAMKATAILVNTARGGLVDEVALANALSENWIGGACLDVVSAEPVNDDNPLLKAPHCLITPHIAWNTLQARKRLMQTTADNVKAFIEGSPINLVFTP